MSNIHEVNVANENLYLELWQYDAGQVLKFVETSIPDGSHVLFANSETRKAIRKEVVNNQVGIPNKFLRATGKLHITIEAFNENEETTLYEINGYIKRRQDGEPGTAPDDEPTFIQKIVQAIKDLQEAVANRFYTKQETDDKDSLTLDTAKNYTDGAAEDLTREIAKKQNKLTPEYGVEFVDNKINVKLADTGLDAFLIFANNKGLRFNWVLLGRYSSFRQYLTDENYSNALVSKADMLYELLSYGVQMTASIDPSTFVMTLQLKNSLNEVLSTATIDLPLESVVVSGSYDAQTKKIILTLQSGQTVEFSVADLVSGLVNTTDLETALLSYYTKAQTDALLDDKADVGITINSIELENAVKSEYIWVNQSNTVSFKCNDLPSGAIVLMYCDINGVEQEPTDITQFLDGQPLGMVYTSWVRLLYSGSASSIEVECKLTNKVIRQRELERKLDNKQAKIDSSHKLNADNVDDSNSTNKFTTQAEKQGWDAKEDSTDIENDTTSTTISLTLENNAENRYKVELTDLTIILPQTIDDDFISGVVFKSGSTPTTMTYDSSIKWTGDDVNNNVFVPAANKAYDFIIWNNGIYINAIVRGVS